MKLKEKKSAEEILDNIFGIMQDLYNAMRLSEKSTGNHLGVFDIVADLGRTLSGADRASFWYWDKRKKRLVTAAATELNQISIDENAGLVGKSLMENRPIIENDPQNCPYFNKEVDKETGYVTKSVLVMPVSNCKGEVIGAFQAINKLAGDERFDEAEDLRRLSLAAFVCGMALESDIFLDASRRDKLTGLKNRAAFDDDFEERYKGLMNAPHDPAPLSIIIADVDNFKLVNDTYGHEAGDAVLVNIAKILESNIRDSDGAYRWGGEEFLIVLAKTDKETAVAVAERIRKAVEASSCSTGENDLRVTMSFGCARFDPSRSTNENIDTADKRLYLAKTSGRNKVVSEP